MPSPKNNYTSKFKDVGRYAGKRGQYVDLLNIKYIDMTKEKRLKNLPSIAKRIFRNDNDHEEIKEVVMEAAREHKCEPGAIKLQGIEYLKILNCDNTGIKCGNTELNL